MSSPDRRPFLVVTSSPGESAVTLMTTNRVNIVGVMPDPIEVVEALTVQNHGAINTVDVDN